MTLTSFGVARGASQASQPAAWLPRPVAAALPFVLILVWSAVVRLPFYRLANGDEFFFSVVASEWLHGGLPYVSAFDVKPPGIFFIYAVAQGLFGASYATFKGLEIVAVAVGAALLFLMLRRHGSGRLAIWCAALYPVYTLAFDGTAAVNMLVQLPFIIGSFAAVAAANQQDTTAGRGLTAALLAGIAIGAAGMIKQTAVFEASAAFIVLAAFGATGRRVRLLSLFVVGAALPALGFAVYFLAAGHFHEVFRDVIVLALQRTDGDVVNAYGPRLGFYLTLPGALANCILRSTPVIFLWGGAFFAVLRRDRIMATVPGRILALAGVWLAFAFAEAVYGRLLVDYYLIAIIPPLLILAGALFCHGLTLPPVRGFWLSIAAAIVALVAGQRQALFGREPLAYDSDLVASTAATIRELGLKPDDRLLVLNRGMALHLATGAWPPTPYFHGTHLMSPFSTPVPNPLTVSLEANPRFIVLADPSQRPIAESASRYQQAQDYLAAHYRVAAVEKGRDDTYTVYELVR